METFDEADDIVRNVIDLLDKAPKRLFIILIGGCSRSGKSSLSQILVDKFKFKGKNSVLVSIDSWLLSLEDRKTNSKVAERYDIEELTKAIDKLVSGENVVAPFYDPITRRKTNGKPGPSFYIESGILIVEGTIVLAIHRLLNISDLNVYVETSDCSRIKRLIHFYSDVKGLKKNEFKKILLARESEEIPFIKNSAKNAHLTFRNHLETKYK